MVRRTLAKARALLALLGLRGLEAALAGTFASDWRIMEGVGDGERPLGRAARLEVRTGRSMTVPGLDPTTVGLGGGLVGEPDPANSR